MAKDLIQLCKDATESEHKETENMHFLRRYTNGAMSEQGHYLHLLQLREIYSALEEHPLRCQLVVLKEAGLFGRLAFLSRDIQDMGKKTDAPEPPAYSSTLKYRDYINSLQTPESLLAHCLVRYLGDLFGGKKISQYLESIDQQIPRSFYQFSDPRRSFMALRTSGQAKKMEVELGVNKSVLQLFTGGGLIHDATVFTLWALFICCINYTLLSQDPSMVPFVLAGLIYSLSLCAQTKGEAFAAECRTAFHYHKEIFLDLESDVYALCMDSGAQANHERHTLNEGKVSKCPLGF